MAPATKIRPPFAWLGKHTALAGLLSVLGAAALFRFLQLSSLPPGLEDGGGRIGQQALSLVEHGWLPGLNSANGYAPLWIWMQALSVKLFGHTEIALRLWPALVGLLGVLTLWYWARLWFGLRIAWLAAFLLAVTPWAVTLSRNAGAVALVPLTVTLTLLVATLWWREQTALRSFSLAAVITFDLLSGPTGWLLVATLLVTGLVQLARAKRLLKFDRARLVVLATAGLGLALFAYIVSVSQDALRSLPSGAGLAQNAGQFASNLIHTLLMFNVPGAGDQNWTHNLAGEPMLNAFVGLMLVAGLLVGISRLHELRYRLLFVFALVSLLPAVVSSVGVPNSAHAAAAMPLFMTLAAIGISYMLELWYRTFPINSAARATGQAMVIVLLGLTFFQSYTQYFRAWAGSSEIYVAYNEGPTQIAARLQDQQSHPKTKYTGQIIVVATRDQQPAIDYLLHTGAHYYLTDAAGVVAMPNTAGRRQFWITQSSRDAAVKAIKDKFPGGHLLPKYSDFNQNEIYYTYEVTK
jgi:hypothetical protein